MKFFLVGKGYIGGIFAHSFWKVNQNGTIGDTEYIHYPSEAERKILFEDIRRHRARVVEELLDLQVAEEILSGARE